MTDTQAPREDQPDAEIPAMDAGVLDREAEHLQQRFPEVTDVAGARAELQAAYDELAAETRHPNMLTASALNLATQRLRERAKQQGSVESRHPRVLFVCHGNAGRSQMASALLVNRSEGRLPARSAGTAPASKVLPNALDAMAEIGIPLHNAVPKSIDPDVVEGVETVVVFTGADPVEWPEGLDVRHWDVPSLTGMELPEVERVRDDLDLRVRELLREFEGGGQTAPIDG